MTLWNPEYRVKVNGSTTTSATLAGLTITSGRTDIYSQPVAGYCNLTLFETNESPVNYDINDAVTIEVKDSTGTFVNLFGGFITDLSIQVQTSGSTALSQRINIVAVGALARLNRAVFVGNVPHQFDGDRILDLLENILLDQWNEVPAAETWAAYDPTTTWLNAENTGLGQIDTPGDFELHSQSNLNDTVYNLASFWASSALGYLYEDSQGRISYADSTHRGQYLSSNGFVELDGNQAFGSGLAIIKKAGDVRNSITLSYGSSGNSTVQDSDPDSISLYGELSSTISTSLRNQSDAESQAAFYLSLRAFPEYQFRQISWPVGSPEIDDQDRDSLLGVFMGMPVNIVNLPSNMVGGAFQGFVEGWTWTAGLNRLDLNMNISPVEFSLQAFQWEDVPDTEAWNTISPTLDWLNATIVA